VDTLTETIGGGGVSVMCGKTCIEWLGSSFLRFDNSCCSCCFCCCSYLVKHFTAFALLLFIDVHPSTHTHTYKYTHKHARTHAHKKVELALTMDKEERPNVKIRG